MAKTWMCVAVVLLTGAASTTAPLYRGKHRRTETTVDAGVKGKSAIELEQIAGQFSRVSPQPDARLDHFKWLNDHGPEFVIDGWQCRVLEVVRREGKDVWLVGIVVSPILNVAGAAALDSLIEEYEYSSGMFRFIGSRAKELGPQRRYIMFN